MTIRREPRATLRERWLQRARETPVVLSNGLMVHGAATGLERRFEHLIGDYFGPGGVETRPGEDGLRHRRGHRHAAREGMTRVLRLCGVTVLVWALLAAAAGSVVASPYPLGESSVTPAPGSELDVPPKGLPVSFTPPASTGWISGRTRFAYLSASQARAIVRRAIRREAGRERRNLRYRCGRKTRSTFVCDSSWSDRKYAWAVRVTVKARANHYVYSARGSRASLSCLKRTSLRRCAVDVHWPTRPLARASASAVGSAPSSGRPQRPVGKRPW